MSESLCEQVRFSAMAVRDGEQPLLEAAELEGHLSGCAQCRVAIEEDEGFHRVLQAVRPGAVQASTVWPEVSQGLPEAARGSTTAWVGAIAGLLVAAHLALLGPGLSLGWAARPGLLLAVVLLFLAIRVNPLRVEPALGQGG